MLNIHLKCTCLKLSFHWVFSESGPSVFPIHNLVTIALDILSLSHGSCTTHTPTTLVNHLNWIKCPLLQFQLSSDPASRKMSSSHFSVFVPDNCYKWLTYHWQWHTYGRCWFVMSLQHMKTVAVLTSRTRRKKDKEEWINVRLNLISSRRGRMLLSWWVCKWIDSRGHVLYGYNLSQRRWLWASHWQPERMLKGVAYTLIT